jgi:hypothetical protein
VVINDFHVFRATIRPTKADAPLIVDTDAVLAGAISSCLSLRRATASILTNCRTRWPFESASVRVHLNDLIMQSYNNVKRE